MYVHAIEQRVFGLLAVLQSTLVPVYLLLEGPPLLYEQPPLRLQDGEVVVPLNVRCGLLASPTGQRQEQPVHERLQKRRNGGRVGGRMDGWMYLCVYVVTAGRLDLQEGLVVILSPATLCVCFISTHTYMFVCGAGSFDPPTSMPPLVSISLSTPLSSSFTPSRHTNAANQQQGNRTHMIRIGQRSYQVLPTLL